MTRSLASLFKSLLLVLMLGVSGLVLALPTPKDIEASVKAGQFDRAETQLREVIKARPTSAKAHYELGQVLARQGRYIEAEQALNEARKLEPSLKFASSAQQFNDLLGTVTAKTAAPAKSPAVDAQVTPVTPVATVPSQPEPSTPWGLILLGAAGVALVVVWFRRSAAAKAAPVGSYPMAPVPENRGFGQGYAPGAAPASPYPQHNAAGYPQSAMGGTGSAVRGAVVGGIAGLAAGYALSKAMEGPQGHDGATPHGASGLQDDGYRDTNSAPSQADLGAFDAGSGGDSWDNSADSSSDSSGGDW
jgi:hypothetical protein